MPHAPARVCLLPLPRCALGCCCCCCQALDDKAKAVACSSSRSCVKSFPTREAYGLIWCFPDSSSDAQAAADAAPLPVAAGLASVWDAGKRPTTYRSVRSGGCRGVAAVPAADFVDSALHEAAGALTLLSGLVTSVAGVAHRRELPYSYDVLVENLADPCECAPHSTPAEPEGASSARQQSSSVAARAAAEPAQQPLQQQQSRQLQADLCCLSATCHRPSAAHLPFSHHRLTPALRRSAAKAMPFTRVEPAAAGGGTAAEPEAVPGWSMEHTRPLAAFQFPSGGRGCELRAAVCPCARWLLRQRMRARALTACTLL